MHFSLTALIRLIVLIGLASCLLAIGVARLEPEPTPFRKVSPVRYGVINGFVLTSRPDAPTFLDVRTGALRRFSIPEGDRLDYGTCSPWQDDHGEFQVVGRWVHQGGEEPRHLSEGFGLARYALPSGRVLNHVSLDVVPGGHPCWLPGTAARILYAGSDGELYRLDFESAPGAEDGCDAPVPRFVTWVCPKPGQRVVYKDPVWPNLPKLGGRLIVSLQYPQENDPSRLSPARLWWLSLDEEGERVVAAGPLARTTTEDPSRDCSEERCPTLTVDREGHLILAFLWQKNTLSRWELRVVPLTFDRSSGAPTFVPTAARTLSTHHVAALPSFSPDGRSIFGIVHDEDGRVRVRRFSTKVSDRRRTESSPRRTRKDSRQRLSGE